VGVNPVITLTLRFPVTVDPDIARAVPTPVPTGPDITWTIRGLNLDKPLRRRLRGDDFDVLNRRRWMGPPLMHHSFFDTTGGHRNDRQHCHVTQEHTAPSITPEMA
jgi:hypothetical protein